MIDQTEATQPVELALEQLDHVNGGRKAGGHQTDFITVPVDGESIIGVL
jgi:hypothetical protein